jgi:hypothetical protein
VIHKQEIFKFQFNDMYENDNIILALREKNEYFKSRRKAS